MFTSHFVQVIAWAFLVALIRTVGYAGSAEKIYGFFTAIFGRAAHRAYLKAWRDLKAAKTELVSISPQDEFAKWARLQRKIDGLQASFDALHASRKRGAMAGETALSIALRLAVYSGVGWWGLWRGIGSPVKSVDLGPLGVLGKYLAMPYLAQGQISVTALLVLAGVSFKHCLQSTCKC